MRMGFVAVESNQAHEIETHVQLNVKVLSILGAHRDVLNVIWVIPHGFFLLGRAKTIGSKRCLHIGERCPSLIRYGCLNNN